MLHVISPWVEGEKIPDERVREIFRPPPGVPTAFYRSSLVIGSRGVGKTTLFRYQKEIHDGIAVHISLAAEFASLTKQTGLGPLAFECPPGLEQLLIGKATSCLAVSVVERLRRKDVLPPVDAFHACLPKQFRQTTPITASLLTDARKNVASGDLKCFEGIAETRPLPALVSALGAASERSRGPLLLLLDRADMVVTASLGPVLDLLDQSNHYVALVAMRPGHAGETIAKLTDSVVAGDHYPVVHLGTEPRSHDWVQFALNAVQAQLGPAIASVPDEIKDWIIALSRDSLKTALELFARYLAAPAVAAKNALIVAMEDQRENQLASAQSTLQKHHRDFRAMLNNLRAEAVRRNGPLRGPLLLSVESRQPVDFFDQPNRVNRFIDLGLRCSALCMPEGQRWVPGVRPNLVEIAPLLAWQKGDSV